MSFTIPMVLLDSSEILFIFLSFTNTRLLLDTSRVLVVSMSSDDFTCSL